MSKTQFLNGYPMLYEYHPDEPIEGKSIRKNASVKSLDEIASKLFNLIRRR